MQFRRTAPAGVCQNRNVPRDSASRNDSARYPRAGDLFTDRIDESTAFDRALAAHREYMDSVEDIPSAKNIQVYYGVGGIGKSQLSERLQDWVEDQLPPTDVWGPKPSTVVDATARIDLHRSQGRVDMVDALVAVRRAFGKIEKRWPAFDLAFSAYWSAIKPGEPLPGAGTDNSAFADGVSDTITDVLSEIGVPGAGIATRSLRALIRELRARKVRHGAFAAYQGFEELLEQCSELPTPDDPHPELLGDIAALLNTDLCNWKDESAPLVTVFIDTFERLTSHVRRVDEATVNLLVWRMPNVLFVITGRSMLDWYDETRTNLHIVGRSIWPGLVPGARDEPRQHLVGYLAMDDRLRIISRGSDLYHLQIDDTVIHELAAASGGLPQYLDLALSLALTRTRNGGGSITIADVTGSLGDLVIRVLEDVPDDEQRALRAAALFPYFSAEIVEAAADVDHGCALRAMSRPMIDHRGSETFPYSMHDAIRDAIRWSQHDLPNGWSPRDWQEAGHRGLSAIERMYHSADRNSDIKLALETLGLAIRLVCDQELQIGPGTSATYEDWLSQAIVFGPSIAGLRAFLPTESRTSIGQGILDFVIAKTTEVSVDEAVGLLTSVFEADHPLRLPAGRHRGYVLRNASRYEEASAAFADLVRVAPTELNRYQQVLTLATARRFQEALDRAHDLSESRRAQIRRACDIPHGRFDNYFDTVLEKVAQLREKQRVRESIENAANVIRWRALIVGDVEQHVLDELEDAAEDAIHLTGLRDVYLARVFMEPETALRDEQALARFENIDRSRNSGEIGFRTAMAQVAISLYSNDDGRLAHIATAMNERQMRRGRLWVAAECAIEAFGGAVTTMPTQWLEPYEVTRARWSDHWHGWLRRVQA